MKLALLSNVVMDVLAQSLPHEVYIPAGFDTWRPEILNKASVFNTEAFDAVFVFLHCKDASTQTRLKSWTNFALKPSVLLKYTYPNYISAALVTPSIKLGLCTRKSRRGYSDAETEPAGWLETLATAAASKPETRFFIANLDIAVDEIRPAGQPQPERDREHYWQSGVCALMGEYPNVFLFDIKSLVEELGRAVFYSPKMWYAGGMPYSLKGIKAIAGEMESLLLPRRKKVLVVDLDNTLWGGVSGEDGIDGIELSEYKEGARFYDLQLRLAELRRTGVVLAIASKNNEDDAYAVIDGHPHMVLRREDFAAARINWSCKADSIREIAQELNLGLDSIVFLDDNPLEREIVKNELPEVEVVEFPNDTALLEKTALDIWRKYFRVLRVTDEDTRKTEIYRQESGRRAISAATPADYIRALEMTVEICRMSDSEVDRVVQLCNKTNQFNLTAKCYDRRDILAFAEDPKAMVLTVRCRDKFGDNGLTGVMIVKEDGDTAYIDSFLLSCRVMGRAIEDHVVAAVVKHYKDCGLARGVTQISAAFIPTGKNKPVERLYDRLGFQIVSESNERTEYMFKIENVFLYPEQMYKKLIISAF